jgi:hypothetical protein
MNRFLNPADDAPAQLFESVYRPHRAVCRTDRVPASVAPEAVPDDRPIDSLDKSDFFLGKSEKAAREVFPIWNSNILMAVKWRDWKLHFYKHDTPIDPL